jgi:ABC-2 type transport system permease protein
MFAEYRHSLRKMRGQMIGWSIGIFLYGLLMSSFYSSIGEIGDQMQTLLESYPPELMAFFPNIEEFATPVGYIDTYFFSYMPLIIGIFAIASGAGLLVNDEEKGILDLLMAHPISRSSLFWGRVAAYVTTTIVILGVGWLSWVIPAQSSGLGLTAFELLTPFVPLLAILLLFGFLALFFSMVLPAGRAAGGLAGALLVANFLLIGISGINEDFKPLYEVTPFYFNQGAKAINGLNWGWLAGLFGVATIFALLAWWRFTDRDIRVGGEGGWRLKLPRILRRSTA